MLHRLYFNNYFPLQETIINFAFQRWNGNNLASKYRINRTKCATQFYYLFGVLQNSVWNKFRTKLIHIQEMPKIGPNLNVSVFVVACRMSHLHIADGMHLIKHYAPFLVDTLINKGQLANLCQQHIVYKFTRGYARTMCYKRTGIDKRM